MARLKITGLDDWSTKLQELGEAAPDVSKTAVYAGAGVVIEAIKASIDSIPEQQGYIQPGNQRHSATRDEKADLKEHFGISHMVTNGGEVHNRVGVEGYSRHQTKQYPNGVPLPLIARSIERGSSVRVASPFVKRAINRCKAQALAAMDEAATKKINEIMGEK